MKHRLFVPLDSISPKDLEIDAKQTTKKVLQGSYKAYPACVKPFPQPITVEQLQNVANIRHPNFPLFYGSCTGEKVEGSHFLTGKYFIFAIVLFPPNSRQLFLTFELVIELLEGCILSQMNSHSKPSLSTKLQWAKGAALGYVEYYYSLFHLKSMNYSNNLIIHNNNNRITWLHCNKPVIVIKTLKITNLLYDSMNNIKVNWVNEYISNCLDLPDS